MTDSWRVDEVEFEACSPGVGDIGGLPRDIDMIHPDCPHRDRSRRLSQTTGLLEEVPVRQATWYY